MNSRETECTINFGRKKINFILRFRERKNLRISVHPNKQVVVTAPIGKDLESILNRVKKRASWIIKQINYFERFQPLPTEKHYVSGETHYYLGRQYRLKVIKGGLADVKLKGRFFYIYVNSKANTKKIKELLDKWYLDHARKIFMTRFEICYEIAKKYHIPRPKIIIRRMLKRWGSCTSSGTITLNTDLVKVPLYCIDYVLMHELCHLKFHSHGKNFNTLLTKCMPDWVERKKRLENFII